MKRKYLSAFLTRLIVLGFLLSTAGIVFDIMPANSSNPGVTFSDDFNDGVADGWTVHSGSWSVVNGEYRVSVGVVENGISTVSGLILTDYTIEAKLRFTDPVGFRAGIVFRCIDDKNYYALELSNEYDAFHFCRYLTENPNYGTLDSSWAEPRGLPVPTYLIFDKGKINAGVEYTLRVTVTGSKFTGSLISKDVNATISWEDSTYTSGYVGLRARRADVSFDDFKVYNAEPIQPSAPSNGLVGYWKFDEGSGTTATDSSGNGNTGTLVNGPKWVNGKNGKALQFDGIDDYVLIPDSPSLRVQSFTLAAWIYMTVRPYQAGHPQHPHVCIINKLNYYATTVKTGYKLDFEYPTASDDTLVLAIGDGAAQRFLVQYNSINDLTLNQWHFVVGTYDGFVAKLYIDGQLKASRQGSYTILHDNTPLCISREITQPVYDGFNGIIDEVRIYNRALSDQEIKALSTFQQPTLTVSCKSSASYTGFKVEVKGSLIFNGTGLSGEPVLLSYSVTSGKSWEDLTLVTTRSDGSYSAVWMPSVTGNYLLKAVWEGNENYSGTSTIINFAVTPVAEQSVFSVTSNSTISEFSFNSTNREISFRVSGESGTMGYVNVYIPKSLIGDTSLLKVYLDGAQIEYTVESQADSWLLFFSYQHSTHIVTISLGPQELVEIFGNWVFYVIIIIIIIVVVIGIWLALRRRGANQNTS
ncbi:MAG: LamG domain-containing protein [Candidatus Bathyarchaeia archaeon]